MRAEATTLAPSWASRAATASPMPRLAPVTMAVRPFSAPFGLTFASLIEGLLTVWFCGKTLPAKRAAAQACEAFDQRSAVAQR